MNEFVPTYSYGSPEATAFITGNTSTDPRATPFYANNYLYDEKTMRESLATVLNQMGGVTSNDGDDIIGFSWPTLTIPDDISASQAGDKGAWNTPEALPLVMMRNAGRFFIRDGAKNYTKGTLDWIPPSAYQPVDTEYLDQLVESGDLVTLQSFNRSYLNVGGHPFIAYQSFDDEGNPLNGLTLMSVADPTYTMNWFIGDEEDFKPRNIFVG